MTVRRLYLPLSTRHPLRSITRYMHRSSCSFHKGTCSPWVSCVGSHGQFQHLDTYHCHTPSSWRHFQRPNYTTTSSHESSLSKKDQPMLSLQDPSNHHLLADIPLSDVRNFCFIAHVDHGKSSLAARVLSKFNTPTSPHDDEPTNTNETELIEVLDTLSVERDRGITVKASAASMLYTHNSALNKHGLLLLNMVDTPGHTDFSMEVTRTLSSIQGVLLLIDSTQGPQAQSLHLYEQAKSMRNVKCITPVLTKVDVTTAKPLEVACGVVELLELEDDPEELVWTSARTGEGVEELLDWVGTMVPPPSVIECEVDSKRKGTNVLVAKVVDSWFEQNRGVVCLVQILSGTLVEGDRICCVDPTEQPRDGEHRSRVNTKQTHSVQDIGLVLPHKIRTGHLSLGQMGYVILGIRNPRQARPGTILVLQEDLTHVLEMVLPRLSCSHLSKSNQSQSVLYASVHPMEGQTFEELASTVEKLAMNDTGLELRRVGMGNSSSGRKSSDMNSIKSSSGGPFLGPGIRVGFQGLLHVEVFQQRLLDEFGIQALVTSPKVPYTILHYPDPSKRDSKSKSKSKSNPKSSPTTTPPTHKEIIEDISNWPTHGQKYKVLEPVVQVRIIAPVHYAGNVLTLLKRKRGKHMTTKAIDKDQSWVFTAQLPWAEVVTNFHEELQSNTEGYASFTYQVEHDDALQNVQEANVTKVEIVLNGELVEPLAFISHKDNAEQEGRAVCKKLQEVLPRLNFVIVIQAKMDGKIIASERIRAHRKDVLTTGGSKLVGGGDVTRKMKVLEKQKRGKKKRQEQGPSGENKVRLTQAVFNSVLSRSVT